MEAFSISKLFKRVAAIMLVVPMLLMYVGGPGIVSAAETENVFNYTCVIPLPLPGLEPLDMEIKTFGDIPDSVKPNEEFSISGFFSEVNLQVDILTGLLTNLQGNVSSFNLLSSNTEKGSIDISDLGDFSFDESMNEDSETVDFVVPINDGGVNIELTAANDGEIVISMSEIVTTVVTSFGPIDVACSPNVGQNLVLKTIAIEDEAEEDTLAPEITLLGDNPMELELGQEYSEPRATAEDNVDGDLTDAIAISGDVNTDKLGEYTITYTVSDAAGNEATETRIVNVVEPSDEEEPTEPEKPSDPVTEVEVGDDPVVVEAGETITVTGTDTSVTLPEDLPEGTTLVVTVADVEEDGFEIAGDVYEFVFTYPNGEEYTGNFTLVMAYNTDEYDEDEVDIYYYNGNTLERQYGEVDKDLGAITLEVSGFSIYGVFAEVVEEEPIDPEEPEEEAGGLWFSGEGEPSIELGEAGDLYLDTTTFNVYTNDGEGWTLVGTLRGEDGAPGLDGNRTLVGEDVPAEELGAVGDLYINTLTGDLYLKEEAGWVVVGNIQGPPGQDGQVGEDSEDGQGGQANDSTDSGNEDSDSTGTASSSGTNSGSNQGGALPATATSNPLFMLIGSLMALAGGAILFVRKKIFV